MNLPTSINQTLLYKAPSAKTICPAKTSVEKTIAPKRIPNTLSIK